MVGDPSRPSGLGRTIPTTDERWRHILHSGQRGVSRTTNRDGGTAEARRGRREAEAARRPDSRPPQLEQPLPRERLASTAPHLRPNAADLPANVRWTVSAARAVRYAQCLLYIGRAVEHDSEGQRSHPAAPTPRSPPPQWRLLEAPAVGRALPGVLSAASVLSYQ